LIHAGDHMKRITVRVRKTGRLGKPLDSSFTRETKYARDEDNADTKHTQND